jgi:type II secretory pathway pseudopilin PulG
MSGRPQKQTVRHRVRFQAIEIMTRRTPTRPRIKPSEEGYMLIAVMFMLAILLIAMSVAVPKISKQIQRDREVETMRRGKQYVRGIKMYYKKFGAYPTSVDALVQTNQIRFLRKKYIDPTTGKDEWKLIHFGQNKTQPMGFFGQPLMGGMTGGLTPGGGPTGIPGAPGGPGIGSPGGANSVFNSNSTQTGTSTDPSNPNAPSGTTPGSTDPNAPHSTDPNAPGGTGPGTGTGLTGQTFGGGGIIGVTPGSPKQSILVYKKKTHYNEWEFFYDPRVETMMQGGNIGAGLNSSNPTGTTNPAGTTGGTGGTTGGTGGTTGGATGGTGSTPSPQ